MKIIVVTPASARSKKGNRITAERWCRHLRTIGHRTKIAQSYCGNDFEILIAINAVKSAESVSRFHARFPDRQTIVIMSGTDFQPRLNQVGIASMTMADRLVVLQPNALQAIPKKFHAKTSLIYQSATRPSKTDSPLRNCFEVSVVGHLRTVKDPFRAAAAAKQLPDSSRIKVFHYGEALSVSMRDRAISLTHSIDRYQWLGLQPPWKTKRRIARSRAMVISSESEGGAVVISEAMVVGTPLIASHIAGNIGMLGDDYAGYFEFRNTRQLRNLMLRCEQDEEFYDLLLRQSKKRSRMFAPDKERDEIKRLIQSIS